MTVFSLLAHSGGFHWYTAVIYLGPLLGVLAWLGIGTLRDRRRAAGGSETGGDSPLRARRPME